MKKHVCFSVRKLTNLIGRKMQGDFQQVGLDEATAQNGWIIMYIYDHTMMGENVYQKDLEKKFSVTRSTTSKVVNLMIKKGFIVSESVESDARLKKLVLTEKATDVVKTMQEVMIHMEDFVTSGLTPDEINTLTMLLNKMCNNFKTQK
ncbi:MAG: MarR family winged helix-turn-helix transcriptional regulator [Lachnospiraceae bacterium]